MRTLVPFDARNPNSRLAPVLSTDERRDFAWAMLRDVLDCVREAGGEPHVLATAELADVPDPPAAADLDVPVLVDDRPLSEAIDAQLTVGGPDGDAEPERQVANGTDATAGTAVVMSDLAIATPAALRRAFVTPESGEIAAAPGLGGGTNVLVVRHPEFSPDYHGTSFRDHQTAADAIGAPFRPVDSFRLAVDVDGPTDLPEVLLHGQGRVADWLADAGFSVVVEDGRAQAIRE